MVNIEFKFYAQPEDGAVLWEDTYPAVPVHNGIFHVTLGATTPITGALLNAPLLFLGLDVNDKGQLTPRQRFVSTAYAVRAGHADYVTMAADSHKLGGKDAAEYLTAEAPPCPAGLVLVGRNPTCPSLQSPTLSSATRNSWRQKVIPSRDSLSYSGQPRQPNISMDHCPPLLFLNKRRHHSTTASTTSSA